VQIQLPPCSAHRLLLHGSELLQDPSRGSDSSLCPGPMPQGQAALAFAEWGTPPETVPHSPPGFHHSFSRLLSQAPLCEKALICSICKVGQSVTVRYNLVVEPGLPVSPPPRRPGFSLACPRSCAAIIDATPLGKRGKGPEFCWEAPALRFASPRCPKPSLAPLWRAHNTHWRSPLLFGISWPYRGGAKPYSPECVE
jgi:hypothetical protein